MFLTWSARASTYRDIFQDASAEVEMRNRGTAGSGLMLVGNAAFCHLWTAQTCAQLGAQLSRVVLPLIAVASLKATPFEIGLVATIQLSAYLLIGLPAGAWVDRWRKERLLLASSAIRAIALAAVPLAAWASSLSLGLLYSVALATGICTVFFDTASQALLPSVLATGDVVRGNSELEASRSASQVVGPSIAGYLAQIFSASSSALAIVATWFGAALLARLIRPSSATSAARPRQSILSDIREGLAFIWTDRLLRALVLYGGVFNFFWAMTAALLVAFLQRTVGMPSGEIGLFFSAAGVAAVAGAVAVRRANSRLGSGRVALLSATAAGLFGLLVPLARPGDLVLLAGIGNALSALAITAFNVNGVSIRQRLCPIEMQGRMSATARFFSWGALPLGALGGGVVAQLWTLRTALWWAAGGATIAFLALVASPLWQVRDISEEAAEDDAGKSTPS